MIKLIIFDAGGVLYQGSQRIVDKAIKKFLKKNGVNDLNKSNKVWSKIEKLVTTGKITLREAHEKWLEDIGLPKTLADEWAEVDKKEIWGKFKKTPGINKLLKNLKKKYILTVLTDTIENKQEKIEKMKIVGVNPKFFNEIFTSHDLGTCKPTKKAFNAPLEKFNVKPKETLFIGDACDELKGAKKIGLATIGFNSRCGDYDAKTLDEIPKILRKLG
jgi:HAD superfamily hydrolase (TIGR01509 family)